MVFRATVCCAALIIGLLAALSVTAQSAGACNGSACGSAQPLNLMNFMNGSGKAGSAKGGTAATAATSTKTATTRHRRGVKTATRSPGNAMAPSPEPPPVLPAAASAYAAQPPGDVQVVSGDEVNAIDLAMSKTDSPAAETNGASPGTGDLDRDRAKWADASAFQTEQYKPASAPAPANDTTTTTTIRDDFWMGRFWSMIGDGYVALMAMIKQLFS